MVLALRQSCSGNQRLFEVLAVRGLQRVKLAGRGIAQIGLENLLNPRGPFFRVALELLLVGPESDRQHFLGLDLGHQWKDFEALQKEASNTANFTQESVVKLEKMSRGQLRRSQQIVFDLEPGETSALFDRAE